MYFQYSLRDWREDWSFLAENSLAPEKESAPDRLRGYFHSRYTNPLEADWKMDRQLRAYRYLEKHMGAFEADSWVISSTHQFTVGKHLASALFRFFSHATDEQVLNEPPPDIICAAAEEHRQNND